MVCGGGGGGGGGGTSTLLPCTVVESSLRRLLGRHTGGGDGGGGYPGRDLTAGKTADTRKVCRVWGGPGAAVCWVGAAATVEARGECHNQPRTATCVL